MKNYIVLLFVFLTFCLGSCKDNADTQSGRNGKEAKQDIPSGWQQSNGEDFSILHPKNWRKDTSGLMGTSLLLFAPADEHDQKSFAVNINVIVQDLPSADLTLDQFIVASLEQINNFIADAKIISSEKVELNGKVFFEVAYTGKQGEADLRFHQYCHVNNGKAYIATLTTLQDSYDTYKDVGIKILKTFRPS